MQEYTEDAQRVYMPWRVSRIVVVVVLASTYATAVCCSISDSLEVLVSIVAGALSFIALAGRSTKHKLMYASALSSVLCVIPSGMFRAMFAGVCMSYLHTAAEMYVSDLCVAAFRIDAVSVVYILFTMQACVIYFVFVLFPAQQVTSSVWFAAAIVPVQVLAVYCIAPIPPIELVRTHTASDSVVYGEVYKKLSHMLADAPFSHFHTEYREIVDVKNGKEQTVRIQMCAVVEKVNFTFLNTALLGVLSAQGSTVTPYLFVFAACTMFSWLCAHMSRKQNVEVCILALCIVLCVIGVTRSVRPSFLFVMACSVYLVPDESTFVAQTPSVVAYSNSVRAVLGAAVFCMLQYDVLSRYA